MLPTTTGAGMNDDDARCDAGAAMAYAMASTMVDLLLTMLLAGVRLGALPGAMGEVRPNDNAMMADDERWPMQGQCQA